MEVSARYYVRDTGLISTEILRSVASLLLNTGKTVAHRLAGISVLDLLLQRGHKSGFGGQSGVLVTDVSVST